MNDEFYFLFKDSPTDLFAIILTEQVLNDFNLSTIIFASFFNLRSKFIFIVGQN